MGPYSFLLIWLSDEVVGDFRDDSTNEIMEREGKGKEGERERGQFAAGKTRVAAAALHLTSATHITIKPSCAGAVRERAST